MVQRIVKFSEKKFTGKRVEMSMTENRTYELWHGFMPLRNKIQNRTGEDLYSIEQFPAGYFDNFDPETTFEKWAAVEVQDFDQILSGLECISIPSGLYAVFLHKGPAEKGPDTYGYIFNTWLPASEYLLDNRPHFVVMGKKYRQDDPESEEEIYIPVILRPRST